MLKHFMLLLDCVLGIIIYNGNREEYNKHCPGENEMNITGIDLNHLKNVMRQKGIIEALVGPMHLAILNPSRKSVRLLPVYKKCSEYPIICASKLTATRRDSGTGVYISLESNPTNPKIDGVMKVTDGQKLPVEQSSRNQQVLTIRMPTSTAIGRRGYPYKDLAVRIYTVLDRAGAFHVEHLLIPVDDLIKKFRAKGKLHIISHAIVFTVKRWIQAHRSTSLRSVTYAISSQTKDYQNIHFAMSDAISYHYPPN
jgi:hypothetical protein